MSTEPQHMPREKTHGNLLSLVLLLSYVAVVHTLDTLAHQGAQFGLDWRMFRWQLRNGFDLFEFLVWFVIPLLIAFRALDRGYFTFSRWKRVDVVLLVVAIGLGLAALLAIRVFPSLRALYGSVGDLAAPAKWRIASFQATWTFSWLIGWEFLHRYLLLTRLHARWPRYGRYLVPLIEGAYHLQKPLPEAAGMVLFSLVANEWTLRRRNILLPFLVHLAIELGLIAFVLLSA